MSQVSHLTPVLFGSVGGRHFNDDSILVPSWRDTLLSWDRRFLWDQERELWDIFQEIDKNGDGRLDATDLRAALARSGVDITPETVSDLVRFLSSGAKAGNEVSAPEDMSISFGDFRDFLIMLPRRATPFEIYKCKLLADTTAKTPDIDSLSSTETVHGRPRCRQSRQGGRPERFFP